MSVVPFSWITLIHSTNAFSLYAMQVSQVWRQVAEISDHVSQLSVISSEGKFANWLHWKLADLPSGEEVIAELAASSVPDAIPKARLKLG